MNNYKSIMKKYKRYIYKFNLKYVGKWKLTCFLNLSKNESGLYLYLYLLKDNSYFKFKINLDDLNLFEPKYVIFRLIENAFVKGSDD